MPDIHRARFPMGTRGGAARFPPFSAFSRAADNGLDPCRPGATKALAVAAAATHSGPLAQLVEQRTLNPEAEGSSPSWPTKKASRDAGFWRWGGGEGRKPWTKSGPTADHEPSQSVATLVLVTDQ